MTTTLVGTGPKPLAPRAWPVEVTPARWAVRRSCTRLRVTPSLHESERSFGGSFDIEPQADGIGPQGVVDDGQQWRELGLVEADEGTAVEMGLGIEPVDGEEDGDGGDALRAEHHLVPTGLQVHEGGRALRQLRSDAACGGGIEVGEPERGLVGRPRRGVGLLDAVDRRPGGTALSPMARRVGEGKAQSPGCRRSRRRATHCRRR